MRDSIDRDPEITRRPLLARSALKVISDPDNPSKATGAWTNAVYDRNGPGDARVDQPAGVDT